MGPTSKDRAGRANRRTLRLTPHQRRRLRAALREARDARVYRRLLGVLLVDDGKTVTEAASIVHASRYSLHRWIERLEQEPEAVSLRDRPRSGRPSRWTNDVRKALTGALECAPDQLGYQAVEWTVPLLIEHLAQETGQRLSGDTLRRELKRRGLAWKRPRYLLAPDPEGEKKTPNSTPATQSWQPSRRALRGRNRHPPLSSTPSSLG